MPRFRAQLLVLATLAFLHGGGVGPEPLAAAEVQAHGFVFERWVADTFFHGYRPSGYTQRWDIPAEANRLADSSLTGLPVNPKAVKQGAPAGFGDALRQYDVAEPFILVLGYWSQVSPGEKRLVKLFAARIEPEAWRALWGPVTRADLERLDAVVKDRALPVAEVRRRARAMKARPPFSEAVFVLNPKIGADGQRRLQCSLRAVDVFRHLAPELSPEPEVEPALWGVAFPGPIDSPPRRLPDPEAQEARADGIKG